MPTTLSPTNKDRLVKSSRLIVRIFLIANRLFFGGVVALLLLTAILSTRFVPLLLPNVSTTDLPSALTGLRLEMLLGLQLLDIPAALLDKFCPALGSAAPGATFSPGGWLAVLMAFVLSRVFTAGSSMRDDLEGTV